jgi:hypothetical protein
MDNIHASFYWICRNIASSWTQDHLDICYQIINLFAAKYDHALLSAKLMKELHDHAYSIGLPFVHTEISAPALS